MCKAIDDMINESREQGKLQMLMWLVQDGDLTVERVAVKAKMTVEPFKKVMER